MCIKYIKSEVISAFAGVKLEDGVGLWQAQAIDDYETQKNCLLARKRDITDDWQALSEEDICHCNSSLSFFDARSMLFHVPAFIIAELDGKTDIGLVTSLTNTALAYPNLFSLFNNQQKSCVANFLEWCAMQSEYDFDKPTIKRALKEFWYST